MTESHVAGHGRFWPLELAEPPPPAGPLILYACNTVRETSNRDGRTAMRSTGGIIADTHWSYAATNPGHASNAITSPLPAGAPINSLFTWRLWAGPAFLGDAGDGPGAEVVVNLSPLPGAQGASPPFSAWSKSGTFYVPAYLVTADAFGFQVAADYAPGPVSVDECWQVALTCLDCEDGDESAAGGLLRGHGALAAEF